MDKKIKNIFYDKKADIPVTILVIGVIAICSFALLSFLSSSFFTKQNFTGLEEMQNLNSKINQYYFYQEQGLSNEKINEILNITDNKIYIEKDKKSFGIYKTEDEFLFSVEYRVLD